MTHGKRKDETMKTQERVYEVFEIKTGQTAIDETESYPVPYRGPRMYCAGVADALGKGYGIRLTRGT